MLKYLTHKLRTQSINEDNSVQEKIDSHDSGTESDGDLDPDEQFYEHDMELSMSSRYDTTSPTDTVCSASPAVYLGPAHSMYDQHSSEEELEVINGGPLAESDEFDSPKRSVSTLNENRKRSLAHSSDDEVRNLLDTVPGPVVNFRTSPPLEALKPIEAFKFHGSGSGVGVGGPVGCGGAGFLNISHNSNRAKTPLILTGSGHGVESIRISCDSPVLMQTGFRSVSPPAKLFHCAVSPRRRPPRHPQQRLHRPHRPCLDFDKMQQLKANSVTTWRHNSEHTGELSVFCW